MAEVSQSATRTAREILTLRENNRQTIIEGSTNNAGNALKLLDYLYSQPVVTVKTVETVLQTAFRTANKLVEQFVNLKLLEETTGQKRNRIYIYKPYMDLFNKPVIASDSETNPMIQVTESLEENE